MTRGLRTAVAPAVGLLVLTGLTGCGSAGSSAGSQTTAGSTAGTTTSGAAAVPGPSGAAATAVSQADRPVRISVPSIGVNSSLVDLGIAKDGTIEVPTDYQRAGWLDRSPAPGQQGPAVIAGHVDTKSGPAVFFRLRDLKPGAKIIVTKGDGRRVTFSVDSVGQYPKTRFPTAAVYGPVPGPVLRLITCGGAFDRSVGHYRDNVVVYAS